MDPTKLDTDFRHIKHQYKEGYRLLCRISRDPEQTMGDCDQMFEPCAWDNSMCGFTCDCSECNTCVCESCTYNSHDDSVVSYVYFVYVNEASVFRKSHDATFWVICMRKIEGKYGTVAEVCIDPFEREHAPFEYADIFRDLVNDPHPFLIKVSISDAFQNPKSRSYAHEFFKRLKVIVHGTEREPNDNPHVARKKGSGSRRR